MERVPVCDQSNGWPTEIFFENLNATYMMGLKANDRFRFGKYRPHHASKKGITP